MWQYRRQSSTRAVIDNGSNVLLRTKKRCASRGATVCRNCHTCLKGIDGVIKPHIIRSTSPIKLTMGIETDHPVVINVPRM